ncbi:hypothetical protein [Hydrogenophaga sp. PAMC20947]|uniref:hypothetical protein n=1 Tax=Hydrogenophaga sp. PAMC20947 TaxID=2565558 RepID=UPI00109E2810|nr:hypothetical protein [Hydrogenophaga sp. PAMC20947]QCB45266.1 hypothetical protein E5678_04035 [Hydrogenophaga sp. PAMC20947]
MRAYARGDEGRLGSLELRYALNNALGFSVFHDTGRTSVKAKPYQHAPNTLKRSGTGLGMQGGCVGFDWRGSEATTGEPDKSLRAWKRAGRRF